MSLLAYARNAHRIPTPPSPLPSHDARRLVREFGFTSRSGWPVDLLPAAEIAADLLARGVSFRRGVGYAEHGVYREADQIARLIPALLDDVAAALPTTSAADWRRYFDEVLPSIEDRVQEYVAAGMEDRWLSDEIAASAYDLVLGYWAAEDDRQREALPLHEANDARNAADAAALRLTAEDLRVSVAARRRLLDAVRPHLAEQHAEAEEDDRAALVWLSSLDGRAAVRRSEVAVLYAEAGSPGALPPPRLRALAEDRWGAPVKLRGHYVHRPAVADTVPVLPLPATPEESPRLSDLALDYARLGLEADGEAPAAPDLARLFGLTPAEAERVHAEATVPSIAPRVP